MPPVISAEEAKAPPGAVGRTCAALLSTLFPPLPDLAAAARAAGDEAKARFYEADAGKEPAAAALVSLAGRVRACVRPAGEGGARRPCGQRRGGLRRAARRMLATPPTPRRAGRDAVTLPRSIRGRGGRPIGYATLARESAFGARTPARAAHPRRPHRPWWLFGGATRRRASGLGVTSL